MSLPQPKAKTSRGSILLLEDAEPSRNIVRFFLEKNHFSVYGFGDGQAALEFVKKGDISDLQLVLTDIMMPNVSGFEFIEKFKQYTQYADVPIFIISALWEKESVLQAKKLGVSGYVLKPITVQKLVDVLTKLFPEETFIK